MFMALTATTIMITTTITTMAMCTARTATTAIRNLFVTP